MAQNATYQTKVYHERGGDRYVAASGGTFAVESVGSIAIYSGAQMTIESGANLELAGANLAGDDMRRLLVSEWNEVFTMIAADDVDGSMLAISNVPKNVRIVNIVGSLKASQCSIWMTSVSAGREVLIRVIGDVTGTFTNNNTSVCLLTSGCIMLNSLGGAMASMHLQTSAASDAFVLFKAVADDTWAVVAEGGDNTES